MSVTIKKTEMPVQVPDIRKNNFEQVASGHIVETALEEAQRCLNYKHKSCIAGCPVGVKISEFISQLRSSEYEATYQIIRETDALPTVCGRVCPQESQCEVKCMRGIKGGPVAIGRLERLAADYHMQHFSEETEAVESNGIPVAVVGAGPSGLTCVGELAKRGHEVTVFETLHRPGGVLIYGTPEFRLPKKIVAYEIENLKKLGVKIRTGIVIGKTISVDELFVQGMRAVFIGSGAGLPSLMQIEGENLNEVYSANEYLTRINLMKAYLPDYGTPILKGKPMAVMGGGSVTMGAARSALRIGAESVPITYRCSMEKMLTRQEEVEHAMEEGVQFNLLTDPVRFIGGENGWLRGAECVKMELGEPDASGRRRPVAQKGSEFFFDIDTVIIAVGTSPNSLTRETTDGPEVNRHGCIATQGETGETSRRGVYAGGDAVTGIATAILVMGVGRKAAEAMDQYIQQNPVESNSLN